MAKHLGILRDHQEGSGFLVAQHLGVLQLGTTMRIAQSPNGRGTENSKGMLELGANQKVTTAEPVAGAK